MSPAESTRGQEYGVRHLTSEQNINVLSFLTPLVSSVPAEVLISLGAVYVNDKRVVDREFQIFAGDKVRAHLEPRRFLIPNDPLKLIVKETDGYIIVDKPAGLPVHGLVDNIKENLQFSLEQARGEKLFITHRLDVETSGLLVFAKDADTQAKINKGFATQNLKRKYVALIQKKLEPGSYVHFMEPSPKAPKLVSQIERTGWLRCELRVLTCRTIVDLKSDQYGYCWTAIPTDASLYEISIELLTGRTHQIRAQLSALDAPIAGDAKYGSKLKIEDEQGQNAIALRAFELDMKD